MAFPTTPVNNQTYNDGTYTYKYNSTFRTWSKIAQTTANIGNVVTVAGNVTTGNTSVTANTLSIGNTTVSSSNVTVGNTTVSGGNITVGTTTVSSANITVGNTTVSGGNITVGNTTVSSANITVGNTTVSASNITVGNTTVSGGNITVGTASMTDTAISVGNSTLSSSNISFGNSSLSDSNLTIGTTTVSNSNLTVGATVVSSGNITVGNTSLSNTIVSANYLVSTAGCVTVGSGEIVVNNSTYDAGIFTATIGNINIGLVANVVLGSASGNVTVQNNLIANGTVTATNIAVGDLYSKRTPITVGTSTVVDQFPAATYRSAKYTIKVGDNTGYQAIEVLLVHDSINSIITIYGSLSTTGLDLVSLNSTINSGNVELLATGLNAGTSLNLMGTYVPD